MQRIAGQQRQPGAYLCPAADAAVGLQRDRDLPGGTSRTPPMLDNNSASVTGMVNLEGHRAGSRACAGKHP
jgi:hypothetical protein